MKSFTLVIPNEYKIENHYLCECGEHFVSEKQNVKCKRCNNQTFYTYDDVLAQNKELLEIREIDNKIEGIIEYPIFRNNRIEKEINIIFQIENNRYTKYQKNDFLLVATFIKLLLKHQNIWSQTKDIWYKIYKQNNTFSMFMLGILEDKEMALWNHRLDFKSVSDYFNFLLKNRPKSIKKAIYEKYENTKYSYEPLFDILVLNSFDDINLQRNIIKQFQDCYIDSNVEEILQFANFLKNNFSKKEIYKFFLKYIKENSFNFYISEFLKYDMRILDKSIEMTIKLNKFKPKTYIYKDFSTSYKFDKYKLKLPKDCLELIQYSTTLKNCLDTYTNKHNNDILIFGVFINNKLKYAIEYNLNSNSITEAKGFANSDIPQHDMNQITKYIEQIIRHKATISNNIISKKENL